MFENAHVEREFQTLQSRRCFERRTVTAAVGRWNSINRMPRNFHWSAVRRLLPAVRSLG